MLKSFNLPSLERAIVYIDGLSSPKLKRNLVDTLQHDYDCSLNLNNVYYKPRGDITFKVVNHADAIARKLSRNYIFNQEERVKPYDNKRVYPDKNFLDSLEQKPKIKRTKFY